VDAAGTWAALCAVPLVLVEVRFLYTYPILWPQHYLLWAFVCAVLYGCAAAALSALVRAYAPARAREAAGRALAALCAAGALVLLGRAVRPRLAAPRSQDYWRAVSFVQRSVRDGDRVWLQPDVHPIGVADASYYWFAFLDLVPYSLAFGAEHPGNGYLPALGEGDLPPCRFEAGLDRSLRFLSGESTLLNLPAARACFRRLVATGRLRATQIPNVYETVAVEEREP
jgi:hypothetical protein